jgi:tRNA C32,U32 (ribose-2'-O)-methylase TrmJ
LNLAAAVQVVCYEFRLALVSEKKTKTTKTKSKKHRDDTLASSEQLDGMYQHLYEALDTLEFFGTNNPDVVMRRLKGLFNRANTTQREVSIVRGICSAMQGKKQVR